MVLLYLYNCPPSNFYSYYKTVLFYLLESRSAPFSLWTTMPQCTTKWRMLRTTWFGMIFLGFSRMLQPQVNFHGDFVLENHFTVTNDFANKIIEVCQFLCFFVNHPGHLYFIGKTNKNNTQ